MKTSNLSYLKYWLVELFCLALVTPWFNFRKNGKAKNLHEHETMENCKAMVSTSKNLGQNKEYSAYIYNWKHHAASFYGNPESFWNFVRRLGLTLVKTRDCEDGVTEYNVKESFKDFLFWYKSDLPKGVRPIVGHNNCNYVKCWWRRKGDTIEIYRPNPNAEWIYKPLPFRFYWWRKNNNGGF